MAHAIYGVIVASAVLAAGHGDTIPQLAVAALVAVAVYWAAERYAGYLAGLLVHPVGSTGDRPRGSRLRRELAHGWEMVWAGLQPMLALLVAGALGATPDRAVLVALGWSTALLGWVGFRIGTDSGLVGLRRLAASASAGVFGAVMIALKISLHRGGLP